MSRLTRDGMTDSVSRDQILRRERGQGNINFIPIKLEEGNNNKGGYIRRDNCNNHPNVFTFSPLSDGGCSEGLD